MGNRQISFNTTPELRYKYIPQSHEEHKEKALGFEPLWETGKYHLTEHWLLHIIDYYRIAQDIMELLTISDTGKTARKILYKRIR